TFLPRKSAKRTSPEVEGREKFAMAFPTRASVVIVFLAGRAALPAFLVVRAVFFLAAVFLAAFFVVFFAAFRVVFFFVAALRFFALMKVLLFLSATDPARAVRVH